MSSQPRTTIRLTAPTGETMTITRRRVLHTMHYYVTAAVRGGGKHTEQVDRLYVKAMLRDLRGKVSMSREA